MIAKVMPVQPTIFKQNNRQQNNDSPKKKPAGNFKSVFSAAAQSKVTVNA